ncbi:MAG: hypothetical protein ACO20F_02695 [Robiginitalea sp.]|jgi:hypothetical protein
MQSALAQQAARVLEDNCQEVYIPVGFFFLILLFSFMLPTLYG